MEAVMIDGEGPATMEAADAALVAGEAPEAPTTETPASAPADQPEVKVEGQPRDEQGRFTETPKAEPEPAVDAEVAPAPEQPGEPTAVGDEPAVDYPAFTYRADGQEFNIPGSAVGEDGVFIPKDHLPEVQQLLSAGKAAFGSVRTRLNEASQQTQAAVKRAEAAEAQGQHILAHFERLIEQSQGQDWSNSPAAQWLQSAAINWPVLKAEAAKVAVEKQREADLAQLQQYQQRDQDARMRPLMDQALTQSVQQYGQRAGLSAEQTQAVHELLKEPRYESLVFIKAPYDDPASGIRQGELVIDYGVIESEVSRAKRWLGSTAQPKPATKPVAQPPKPAAKIPPTVGAKGTKAPSGGVAVPAFKTTKEADAWFERGGYNEMD